MATTNETILLTLAFESTEAVKNIAKNRQEIEALKKQREELIKVDGKNAESTVKLTAAIKDLEAQTRAQERALQAEIKASREAEGSYNQLSAQYTAIKEQLNAMSAAERTGTEEGQRLEEQSKAIYLQMNELQKATGKATLQVGDYSGEVFGAANSLAAMRQRLADIEKNKENLDVGSDAFRQAGDDAEKLRYQIDFLSGKVDEFGNKEPKNPVKRSFEDALITGAIFGQGLSAINGQLDEGSTLAEANAKAIQSLALAQTVANVAKEKGAIVDTLAGARTIALTGAQRAYTAVVGTSTGALRTFKIALAATGIGAVVVLLAELIFNWEKVNGIIRDGRDSIRNFATETLGLNESLVDAIEVFTSLANPIYGVIRAVQLYEDANSDLKINLEALNEQYDKAAAALDKVQVKSQRQIELAKAQGKSEEDLEAMTRNSLQGTLRVREAYAKRAEEIAQRIIAANGGLSEDEQKLYDTIKAEAETAAFELDRFNAEAETKRREKAKENRDKRLEAEREFIASMNELNLKAIEDEDARSRTALALQLYNEGERVKALKISRQQQNELLLALQQQFYRDLAQIDADAEQRRRETEQAAIDQRLQDRIEGFNELIRQSEAQAEIESARAELDIGDTEALEKRKLEIRLEALNTQLGLIQALADADGARTAEELQNIEKVRLAIAGVQKQLTEGGEEGPPKTLWAALGLTEEEEEAANATISFIGQSVGQLIDGITQRYENQKQAVDARYSSEIAAIEKSSLTEQEKEKKIADIEKKAAKEKYDLEVKQFNASKAMQITNAIIQGIQSALAAYSSGMAYPLVGPATGAAFAAISALFSTAQIAAISATQPPPPPQFFDGGFTERSGNQYLKSRHSDGRRTLHHEEYVSPKRVLDQPAAWPHIMALESMRQNIKGTLPLTGFANGGFVTAQSSGMTPGDVADIVAATVATLPAPVVLVSDINSKQNAGDIVVSVSEI